ncbi:hypothetical protein IST455A_05244 [Burkholderia multivorans]|nr:hypothetical protein [Burkholderia multivorans]MDR8924066.1 hypothetical protein [Burkholderia multivorans]MDR8968109.1 hypothetical protein [Burkholderia multivorans]MDR8992658.1 hypothetical protein [Burkholderia multivorans]MDR9023421.1 hypothetical protein [Burkholderia multivorans]
MEKAKPEWYAARRCGAAHRRDARGGVAGMRAARSAR